MSIIPLDLQRRFERRWAARFGSLTRAVPKSVGLKGSPVNARRTPQNQRKTRRREPAPPHLSLF
jgi:hypothetical protein